ncbi:MAG: VCBS repeat-containing protein, partial [Balneolaceae bacterium]|nr:VCBS repeat-containing protein [Balneolaceae bacterium]
LPDLYLTANRGPNHLYINKGDFVFENVTNQAGVSGSKPWTAGASFVDINADGFVDIYISNSGEFETDERRNELFINNGDSTFTESAENYGLDDPGYSIHASFFDYDLDGDLDMYLVNNSDAAIGEFELNENHRIIRDEFGGDKLFRNDSGFFTDVSEEAGIYGSEIGFGLSASISDLNRDGYPDIYVANDFFEHDYLYMNNGNGTFDEVLTNQMYSTSAASMGTDVADLTNNGWADIYVSDMLPTSDQRTKQITTYENWERFSEKKNQGYHYQLTRNTLQLNNGNGTYSEIGRLANVQASDWSWAVLIADYDLNGHNDILITNGLLQDITNLDYIQEINNPDMVRSIISEENVNFRELIEMIPSNPMPNVLFSNLGDLQFQDKAADWGLGEPGYSSGAAWADFDKDGDLDIIINDVNGPAKMYRNLADEQHPERGKLAIKLHGQLSNKHAIGAKLEVWADSSYFYREHFLQRGYQASVEPGFFVGLGDHQKIDSLKVHWTDGNVSKLLNLDLPALLTMDYTDAATEHSEEFNKPAFITEDVAPGHITNPPLLTNITEKIGLDWTHQENEYVDFNREHLLVHMRSTEGPALCQGDVNGDGLDDFYIGGARNQPGILVLQNEDSEFTKSETSVFQADTASEDTDCTFFDANGDELIDLYVTSGGNSYSTGASALFDRLYLNDGTGNFQKDESFFPPGGFSTNSTVSAGDFNNDGAADLFVGERLRSFALGVPASGYLLINDGEGNFEDKASEWTPAFEELGMITDSEILDWDGDGIQDLVVVGEWMAPRIFRSTGSSFQEITDQTGLSDKQGLWNKVLATDLDGDGREDLVLGNHGLNSHFRTSEENPLKLWISDFENNGVVEQIISRSFEGKDYPFVLKHDLTTQIPSLNEKYPQYSDYADQTIQDIFSEQDLENSITL